MALKRLTPGQRVKTQETAYEKTKYLEPAQEKRHDQEMGSLRDRTTDEVAQRASQGGYQGRMAAGEAIGQTAQEISGLASQQASQEDALSFQGARQKEGIISSRQKAASTNFARENQQKIDALTEAVTQRAFDLGMESKELIFHNNSLVADAGFEALKRDFENGRVDRRELQNLARKEAINAQQYKLAAERMLSKRWGEMMLQLQKGDIAAAKESMELMLRYQKEAARRAARAANIGAIISGVATIGGGIVGGAPGAAMGNQLGGILGGLATN